MSTTANPPAAPRSGRSSSVRRTPLAWLAVLATIVAAVFGLAAPAQAGGGLGTNYWWTYTSAGYFAFNGALPGVQAYANGTDVAGARAMNLVVRDTVADGKCANVQVHLLNVGYVGSLQTCGNGTQKEMDIPAGTGQLLIHIFRTVVGDNDTDGSVLMSIPDSSVDTAIRSHGTGVSLNYVSATAFNYKMVRPGAQAIGGGNDIGTGISFSGQLTRTGTAGCAKVQSNLVVPPVLASNCTGGTVVNYLDIIQSYNVLETCYRQTGTTVDRCLIMFQP